MSVWCTGTPDTEDSFDFHAHFTADVGGPQNGAVAAELVIFPVVWAKR